MNSALLILGLCSALPIRAAIDSCATAQDMVVQALEKSEAASDLQPSLQLLRVATQSCPQLGNAWYYRSLFESKLGQEMMADFSLRQASTLDSQAYREKLNPFSLAAPYEADVPNKSEQRVRWALVIGAGKAEVGPELPFVERDAKAFADLLAQKQELRFFHPGLGGRIPRADSNVVSDSGHVVLLTDEKATTGAIRAALAKIGVVAKPRDAVVIFVSGRALARADGQSGSCLVTYDTDVSQRGEVYRNAMPLVEVSEYIRSLMRARRIEVIIDVSRAGGAESPMSSASPSLDLLKGMSVGYGREILASSSEQEKSAYSNELGHGVFSYTVMKALKSRGPSTPLTELWPEIGQEVAREIAMSSGMTQHVQFFASEEREHVEAAAASGKLAREAPGRKAEEKRRGSMRQPVILRPEERGILQSHVSPLQDRAKNLSASLKNLESADDVTARQILRENVTAALAQLNQTQRAFEAVAMDRRTQEAASVFFEDLQRGYEAASAAIDRQQQSLLRDDRSNFEEVIFFHLPAAALALPSALAKGVLLAIDENRIAYTVVANTGSLTFDLKVESTPPGATIYFKRRGDDYKQNPEATNAEISNLECAIWTIRVDMEGYVSQEITHDPYRNADHVINVTLKRTRSR